MGNQWYSRVGIRCPQPGWFYFPIPRGAHAVRLVNEASVSQYVRVKPGTIYSLTFGATRTSAEDRSLRCQLQACLLIFLFRKCIVLRVVILMLGFNATSGLVKVTFHYPGIQEDPTCGLLIEHVTKSNLIKLGGFEADPHVFKNLSTGVLILPLKKDKYSAIPGWMIQVTKPVKYIDSKHFSMPLGIAAIELIGGRETGIADHKDSA